MVENYPAFLSVILRGADELYLKLYEAKAGAAHETGRGPQALKDITQRKQKKKEAIREERQRQQILAMKRLRAHDEMKGKEERGVKRVLATSVAVNSVAQAQQRESSLRTERSIRHMVSGVASVAFSVSIFWNPCMACILVQMLCPCMHHQSALQHP